MFINPLACKYMDFQQHSDFDSFVSNKGTIIDGIMGCILFSHRSLPTKEPIYHIFQEDMVTVLFS